MLCMNCLPSARLRMGFQAASMNQMKWSWELMHFWQTYPQPTKIYMQWRHCHYKGWVISQWLCRLKDAVKKIAAYRVSASDSAVPDLNRHQDARSNKKLISQSAVVGPRNLLCLSASSDGLFIAASGKFYFLRVQGLDLNDCWILSYHWQSPCAKSFRPDCFTAISPKRIGVTLTNGLQESPLF